MKISITIADDTHRQLNELLCAAKEIGTMGKDSTLSDLVGYAADSMGDGWRRPGSWERGIIQSMFGID